MRANIQVIIGLMVLLAAAACNNAKSPDKVADNVAAASQSASREVAEAQRVGGYPGLDDIETVLLQQQRHGPRAVEIAVLDIYDRAPPPKYPRRQRRDIVVEAEQHTTRAERCADLIE